MMGDGVKAILAKPIQLADAVIRSADFAHSFPSECADLKSKTERLAVLLRQAARAELYERPTRRIMDDTSQALDKTLLLIDKCRSTAFLKRLFTIIPANSFRKQSVLLDNSLGDVSWLLRVSASNECDDDGTHHLGLPPIAQNEPILFLIWEQIATLTKGSLDDRADAAASLCSLARDNERHGKFIIQEDGVTPLLRLIKEGRVEGQEAAAKAIGLLARDPESVEQMVHVGVCSAFAKALKEAPMSVQAMVAWATAELAANHASCQDVFAQNNVIRLLVGHLAFETVQEHSKYTIQPKVTSIHTVVMANNTTADPKTGEEVSEQSIVKHPLGNHNNAGMHTVIQNTLAKSAKQPQVQVQQQQQQQAHIGLSGASIKGREFEDVETKATMKAMAAKALSQLAKGNPAICKSITESRALLCFAVLLEKGTDDVQYNSALALMEIARVAEQDAELRRSAFKPNSPAAKAVVDQLIRIVEKADYDDLLIPCIVSLGCLSRTFRATETRIIGPLVKLLDESERDAIISKEAAVALGKFACTENYLHPDHSKAIIDAGGAKHLVQLVYFGETMVQIPALVLLCYIAFHVPDSEALAQAEVLTVLEWASKQASMVQDPAVDTLLPETKVRLELYQSRGSRGYH